jgi:hypothetical protein
MKTVNSLYAVFAIVKCAIYFQIEAAFATSSVSPLIQSEQKMVDMLPFVVVNVNWNLFNLQE